MAKIGLVLSGGMAKGAYQLGALKAIQEFLPPHRFEIVSASSVGALNAYAFLTGHIRQAEEMWCELCDSGTRMFVGKVLRSTFLQQCVKKVCAESDCVPTSCFITLLNLSKRAVRYVNLQKVPQAELPLYLRASVAMPIYNRAVQIGQESYYDGAMVDNIPVYPLVAQPPDYVLCLYFDEASYIFETDGFDRRVIKLTYPARNHLKESVFFRKESTQELLDLGYARTLERLQVVFAKGTEDVEYIRQCIAMQNERSTAPKLRVTGDVLVTNLNRITQKFANRTLK